MQKRNRKLIVYLYTIIPVLVTFMSVLSGCALSPQVIDVNPDIQLSGVPVASKPLRLGLHVVDSRSSPVIGQRGGVYKDTSDISTSENMTGNLHRQLSAALKQLGYTVAGKDETPDADLTVNITNMKYTANSEKLLNKIEIRATIHTLIAKNGKQFNGDYSTTRKNDYVKLPDIEENAKIVNEVLAVVLQSMLQDKDLVSFLQD